MSTFYHARIYRNQREIAKMPGRYNTKQQLDKWVADNWPYPLDYLPVARWQTELVLRIWREATIATRRIVIIARHPEI